MRHPWALQICDPGAEKTPELPVHWVGSLVHEFGHPNDKLAAAWERRRTAGPPGVAHSEV